MFCMCGSSKLPIVPLSEIPGPLPLPAPAPVPVPVLDSVTVQDPSSTLIPIVLLSPSLDVSSDPVQMDPVTVLEVVSETLIQKIDEVLQTIPEDPVQSAIAKLWLPPPGRSPVVLGAPMSRATQKS